MNQARSSKVAAVALAVTLLSILVLFNLSQLIPPSKTHNLVNILPKQSSDSHHGKLRVQESSIKQIKVNVEIKNGTDNLNSKKLEEKLNLNPPKAGSSCGYQSCPTGKEGFINVHLVAHSHDDVGWLNTMDQYYSGSNNHILNASVVNIIDSVVSELQVDPSRKFIYAEIAFFQRWWNEQNDEKKKIVRDLVANGQLEFINGGWCMNDEATTLYIDIIDQMSLGLNFLNETFGECGRPKIAWQIDPYGHSKEHASIMAQMGFDGMFLSRIFYQDLIERKQKKNMEMVWTGNSNLGVDGKLFTGVLFNHYLAPFGFCFDGKMHKHCHDQSINETNASRRVIDFFKYCQRHADSYRTNNILVTMGNDFTYENATHWFTPMDLLIKHANKLQETGGKFNLFYSTPSCYAKAVNDHHNVSWPTKTDDFFPHGATSDAYWTGFYSSRPALKYMVRQGSNLLQSCKQMISYLTMKSLKSMGDISVMKKAIAVMQHHDAVTGTQRQHVADDYTRLLHQGVEECQKIQADFYRNELPKNSDSTLPPISYCNLNISHCETSEKADRFVVNVYNSQSTKINKYVRVPVVKRESNYKVLDPNGDVITYDLMPIATYVQNLPGRKSSATSELVFLASQLPPLGGKSYYIERTLIDSPKEKVKTKLSLSDSDEKSISNERITVHLNETTGLIRSVLIDGEQIELKQELMWYAGERPGFNTGAYLFRPNQTNPFPLVKSEGATITIHKGELVQEIHQTYNDWVGQTIRIYKGQDHIEFDWVVGPIPNKDGVTREIISRFTSKLASKKEFYTDSNGRQIVKRKIDARDSFEYQNREPVAGNYYPINSQISLKDEIKDKQLTVLVDRAQGGASLIDGQLELMVHRRVVDLDVFAVQEALNETAYGVGLTVRGTHFLLLGGIAESARLARSLSNQLYKQPQVSFIATDLSFEEWAKRYKTEVRILNKELPENVAILTMEPRSNGKHLLRLEHSYSAEENPKLFKQVTVNLKSLFNGFTITSLEETLLDGNQLKKDSKRMIWKEMNATEENKSPGFDETTINLEKVLLKPMQIRSFILNFEKMIN